MKRNLNVFVLLLAFTLSACKKETIEHRKDFDKSFDTWLDFKASANNNYKYQLVTKSWTGLSTQTTITVKGGKAIERAYVAQTVKHPGNVITIHEEWVENQLELNSHKNYGVILTLDEIYEKAKTEFLIKRDDGATSFESKNNGMISRCGFTPKGCVDDCFNGYAIAFIERI
ncbi:hypothetical protein [Pedobacter sp. Leaf176]|uniref:hypothetical protein n=1 Tax=Pedobacter sp. Leaf176 TaxID=1736286 RepID=UPI0006F3C067|nr:hypothetical protein [Pedobacter sp. Leaf176]KQR69601.1 hypothetical protein ASF92_12850 [Pedobacter sp. Leaf176]